MKKLVQKEIDTYFTLLYYTLLIIVYKFVLSIVSLWFLSSWCIFEVFRKHFGLVYGV
jgi:hypothetical protein